MVRTSFVLHPPHPETGPSGSTSGRSRPAATTKQLGPRPASRARSIASSGSASVAAAAVVPAAGYAGLTTSGPGESAERTSKRPPARPHGSLSERSGRGPRCARKFGSSAEPSVRASRHAPPEGSADEPNSGAHPCPRTLGSSNEPNAGASRRARQLGSRSAARGREALRSPGPRALRRPPAFVRGLWRARGRQPTSGSPVAARGASTGSPSSARASRGRPRSPRGRRPRRGARRSGGRCGRRPRPGERSGRRGRAAWRRRRPRGSS